MEKSIFEANYKDYCHQIAALDISSMIDALGLEFRDQETIVPFLDTHYIVSDKGFSDELGKRPHYIVCVILSKYLLLCPNAPVVDKEWVTLKNFRKLPQSANLNVFSSKTESPIVKLFSGQLDALSDASQKLDGKPCDMGLPYDFAMEFTILPQIRILLLFNDRDNEFPASCSVLFQRQAEHYLDPESLIMAGIAFTHRLIKLAKENT